MKVTIDAQVIRRAMLHVTTDQTRMYLTGFHLTRENVVATTGHTLYYAEVETPDAPENGVIVVIDGKIPSRATELTLEIDDETGLGTVDTVGPCKAACKLFKAGTVDLSFPDWRQTIPKTEEGVFHSVGLQGKFLTLLGNTFTDNVKVLRPKTVKGDNVSHMPWVFERDDNQEQLERVIIMPYRLDK